MHLNCRIVVLGVLAPLMIDTVRAPAQEALRVVRHAPTDTARAGDVITVSFDRPVAEEMGRLPRADRILRIDPPIPATIEWRDPAMVRALG